MDAELKNILAEIKEIKHRLNAHTYGIARFGYQMWINQNREKTTIEKLKFMRDYFKAYDG
jgi:hypothetical protein